MSFKPPGGQIKWGGGPDSARRPYVWHLCCRVWAKPPFTLPNGHRSFSLVILTCYCASRTFGVGPGEDVSAAQRLPPRAHGPRRHEDAPPPHHRDDQDGGSEGPRLSRQPRRLSFLAGLRGLGCRPIGCQHQPDPTDRGVSSPTGWCNKYISPFPHSFDRFCQTAVLQMTTRGWETLMLK